jgi:hypothetical protein
LVKEGLDSLTKEKFRLGKDMFRISKEKFILGKEMLRLIKENLRLGKSITQKNYFFKVS